MTNVFPLFKMTYDNKLSLWNSGCNRIRFCYVGILVDMTLQLINNEVKGMTVLHVGDAECLSLSGFCEKIAKVMGVKFTYSSFSNIFARSRAYLRFVTNRFKLSDSTGTHFNFDKWSRDMEVDISTFLKAFPDSENRTIDEALSITLDDYRNESALTSPEGQEHVNDNCAGVRKILRAFSILIEIISFRIKRYTG